MEELIQKIVAEEIEGEDVEQSEIDEFSTSIEPSTESIPILAFFTCEFWICTIPPS